MGPLGEGVLIGWLSCCCVAAVGAAYAYRRFVLLERRARQAERLAELGTLTGGLAHEIKNPLSTVQLNLQLLAEDLSPHDAANARISNRLKTVQREAARLKDILDDFLRYAGKLELDRKPTELNDMLEELADFFSPQAQLQRVQLRVRPHPTQLVVAIDPKLIKQAVLNLMLNALQALSNGGEILLGARRTPDEAIITVTDTGPGIAPDVADRIFQAYYSTKTGGTGLGLAMTRRIAEEHGGRITLSSEVGKGSEFCLHLPVE